VIHVVLIIVVHLLNVHCQFGLLFLELSHCLFKTLYRGLQLIDCVNKLIVFGFESLHILADFALPDHQVFDFSLTAVLLGLGKPSLGFRCV